MFVFVCLKISFWTVLGAYPRLRSTRPSSGFSHFPKLRLLNLPADNDNMTPLPVTESHVFIIASKPSQHSINYQR